MKTTGNATNLLKEIRRMSLLTEANTSVYHTLDKSNNIYYIYIYAADESNVRYSRKFKNIVEAIEHLGGPILWMIR